MKLRQLFARKRTKRLKGFEELSDDVTDVLKKIVIILLILLVASQLVLQIPQVRLWITGVDRLEGTPF